MERLVTIQSSGARSTAQLLSPSMMLEPLME
ncbi:Uncharacterised protein [Vibrio cholerae]|nr:Uncharacterised protein [Vibrio cholerae]CSD48364.1 Uncharacterised protein [Vibrio cholerae]CSI52793.1 Uncharacterised protein [Vibrio cholerae]